MDMTNEVDSFEKYGMIDPFRPESIDEAKTIIEELQFDKDVYSESVMGPLRAKVDEDPYKESFDHPKCIFVPSREITRVIIRALVEFGSESENTFLLRFGLLEHPRQMAGSV